MLFGKNKKEKKEPAKEIKPKVEPYEIRVMPEKFHKFLAVKKKGIGRWILITGIILAVLGGVALGAFYLISQMDQEQPMQPSQPANLNQQAPANINENENENENINENVNVNENINENENVNADENINANENINQNINENVNINAPQPPSPITYSSSLDSDKDDLTDVEEELYGTEKRKPDTDADGFIDGQEIINGYNPKAAGSSLLKLSGLVNKYTNPIFNYEILHLANWLARPTDQSLTEIIFQSATGEYIQVLMGYNPNGLDLVEWYIDQSPSTDVRQLERETTKKGYDALISPDKLTYYLADKDDLSTIYIITYNIGNKTKVNFLTTFKMMINSFLVLEQAEAEQPAEAEE